MAGVGKVFDSYLHALKETADFVGRQCVPGPTDILILVIGKLSMFEHFA